MGSLKFLEQINFKFNKQLHSIQSIKFVLFLKSDHNWLKSVISIWFALMIILNFICRDVITVNLNKIYQFN
jgi:hypothetical protein